MDLIINLYLFLFLICACACYFVVYELINNGITAYKWLFVGICWAFLPFVFIAIDILIN